MASFSATYCNELNQEINIEFMDGQLYFCLDGDDYESYRQSFLFTKEQTQDLLLKLIHALNDNKETDQ